MEPDEDFVDQLEQFVDQFKAGTLSPYLKSQAPPARQTGPVKVLVAKTIEQELKTPGKHFLVEFYAPWWVRAGPD